MLISIVLHLLEYGLLDCDPCPLLRTLAILLKLHICLYIWSNYEGGGFLKLLRDGALEKGSTNFEVLV